MGLAPLTDERRKHEDLFPDGRPPAPGGAVAIPEAIGHTPGRCGDDWPSFERTIPTTWETVAAWPRGTHSRASSKMSSGIRCFAKADQWLRIATPGGGTGGRFRLAVRIASRSLRAEHPITKKWSHVGAIDGDFTCCAITLAEGDAIGPLRRFADLLGSVIHTEPPLLQKQPRQER